MILTRVEFHSRPAGVELYHDYYRPGIAPCISAASWSVQKVRAVGTHMREATRCGVGGSCAAVVRCSRCRGPVQSAPIRGRQPGHILTKNHIFDQKSHFRPKITLIKPKLLFCPKITFFVQKSFFLSKIPFFDQKSHIFDQKSNIFDQKPHSNFPVFFSNLYISHPKVPVKHHFKH